MTIGGAAQVAAAHCPNEPTLDPAVCSYNGPTYMPQPAVLWPSPCNVLQQMTHYFGSEYIASTNCYSFTYPGGMEG